MSSTLSGRVEVIVGDITTLVVDAIVTSANGSLSGGGGVDGAVHRVGGSSLRGECRDLGSCPEGEARITGGHGLPARFVIHAVGPVWKGGGAGEAVALASCYRAALGLAADRSLEVVAFPCIATGIYEYPPQEACEVAVATVLNWLREQTFPKRIVFCCYSEEDAQLYRNRLGAAVSEPLSGQPQ